MVDGSGVAVDGAAVIPPAAADVDAVAAEVVVGIIAVVVGDVEVAAVVAAAVVVDAVVCGEGVVVVVVVVEVVVVTSCRPAGACGRPKAHNGDATSSACSQNSPAFQETFYQEGRRDTAICELLILPTFEMVNIFNTLLIPASDARPPLEIVG